MVRKSVWLAVLAVGALAMGCMSETASVLPGGTGEAVLGAFEAPSEYQMSADVSVNIGAATAVGMGFTYFFDPIRTADVVQPLGYESPRGLATFFWDKNHAGFRVSDFENFGDAWSIDGVYLVPNTKLQVVAEIGGAINNPTNRPWWFGVGDELAYKAGVQYAFMRNLKARCNFTTEGPGSQVDVGAIYVAKITEMQLAAFLEAVIDTSGVGDVDMNLGLDLYINKDLSVGFTMSNALADIVPRMYIARAQYYYGPLSLTASYVSMPGAGNDVTSVKIGYDF